MLRILFELHQNRSNKPNKINDYSLKAIYLLKTKINGDKVNKGKKYEEEKLQTNLNYSQIMNIC